MTRKPGTTSSERPGAGAGRRSEPGPGLPVSAASLAARSLPSHWQAAARACSRARLTRIVPSGGITNLNLNTLLITMIPNLNIWNLASGSLLYSTKTADK